MLVAGALALLTVVVVAIGALVALDMRRVEHRHWLDALKSWQQLFGGVLGFLSAAGVLVLSTAIATDAESRKSAQGAHAIGLGLAIEVERMATGLKLGKAIGDGIDLNASPDFLAQTCRNYAAALSSALLAVHPVYDAVLPRMVDFGDENLSVFVRFYSFFDDFRQSMREVDETACNAAPKDEIVYVQHQSAGGLKLYSLIAARYEITPADAGMPSASSAPATSSADSPSQ